MKKIYRIFIVFIIMILTSCVTNENNKPHEHNYGNWQLSIEATCEKEGEEIRICSLDKSHIEKRVIPAIGHQEFVAVEEIQPTCLNIGYTEELHCSICQKVLVSRGEIDKIDHIYGEWIEFIAATTTTNGQKYRQCIMCKRYEYVETPMIGHTYSKVGVEEPTCSEKGYSIYECDDCDDVYYDDYVPKLKHDYNDTIYKPTCEEDGYTLRVCKNCDVEHYSNIVDQIPHQYGEWEIINMPTCEDDGEQVRYCKHCNKEEYAILQKIHCKYEIIKINEVRVSKCIYCDKINEVYDSAVDFPNFSMPEKEIVEEVLDCERDYSFLIYAPNCENLEEYIRENLTIQDAYYLEENENVYYDKYVIKQKGDYWEICPSEEHLYDFGNKYIVRLNGNLSFVVSAEYGMFSLAKELHFTTKVGEMNEVIFKDDIVYLSYLEKKYPGYGASNLVIDDDEKSMTINVYKIDGIKIGDVLCIGPALNSSQLEANQEGNCLGKVSKIIATDNDEYIIKMVSPALGEIYETLDIFSENELQIEDMDIINPDFEEQIINNFYASEDFANFLASVEKTSNNYARMRNLRIPSLMERNFNEAIKVEPEFKLNGNKIEVSLTGSIDMDIYPNNGNGFGKFYIKFKVYLILNFDVLVNVKISWGSLKKFDIQIKQNDTIGFTFSVGFDFEYDTPIDLDYVYSHDSNSGKKIIHIAGCSKIFGETTEITKNNINKYIANEDEYVCCDECQPEDTIEISPYIIDIKDSIIHTTNCKIIENSNSDNHVISYSALKQLKIEGYKCCANCDPDHDLYSTMLNKTFKHQKWGATVHQIKKWVKNDYLNDVTKLKNELPICKVPISLYETLVLNIDLSIIINFEFNVNLTYNYEITSSNVFGVKLSNGKIVPYSDPARKVTNNDLTIAGNIKINVGVKVNLSLSLTSCRLLEIGVGLEIGVYIDIDGILHFDFVNNKNYHALQVEIGVYLKGTVNYRVLFLHGSITIFEFEIPIDTIGVDEVYYSYVNKPNDVIINNNEIDINIDELLIVNVYDVSDEEDLIIPLNPKGGELYDIDYSFEVGEYLEYNNGKIYFKDVTNAPAEFEDKLIIKVVDKYKDDLINKELYGWVNIFLDEIVINVSRICSHEYALEYTENPTCTKEGYNHYGCKYCSDYYCTTIDILDHIYTDEIVEPTCTEEGYALHVCSLCEDSYQDAYVGALGHDESEWIIDIEAECLKSGSQHTKCNRCGITLNEEVILALGHAFNEEYICIRCDKEKTHIEFFSEGDNIYAMFGKYPQTVVNDDNIIASLNGIASTNDLGYIEYEGEEYKKVTTDSMFLTANIFMNGNKVEANTTYYFKVEPIKWKVILNNNGTYMLFSNVILDYMNYTTVSENREVNGEIIYPYNYEYSSIRAWLNGYDGSNYSIDNYTNKGFYNIAFDTEEKEFIQISTLDNTLSLSTTEIDNYIYSENEISDKIFLLSTKEVTDATYGFESSVNRTAISSDYVRSYASFIMEQSSEYYGYGGYILRSAYYDKYMSENRYDRVIFNGLIGHSHSHYIDGIRPALIISIPESVNCSHKFETTIFEPTCSEQGYNKNVCWKCAYVYKDNFVETLSHTESDWIIDIEPSCTEVGYKHIECTVCFAELENEDLHLLDHEYDDTGICINCEEKYKPEIFVENNQSYLYLGRYPQIVVTDTTIIANLNSLSETNELGYIEFNGEEYKKVVASPHRSYYTFINGNTITSEEIYYFKVEPIKWRVLTSSGGTYKLLSEMILDNTIFYRSSTRIIDFNIVYSNNYEFSNIRAWLNGYNGTEYKVDDYTNKGFIDIAFTELEKQLINSTIVDNSLSSTGDSLNSYVCNNTTDKIYLLSNVEAINTEYGFCSGTNRTAQVTDYARSIGCYMNTTTSYSGPGYWLLRSPYQSLLVGDNVCIVDCDGYLGSENVDNNGYGVRPALEITI